jgi:FlaA1/EpsC-like NDP-sugar epimerase
MRNRYVLLADLVACAVAVCGAFALRFDLYFLVTRPEFVPYVLASPVIKVGVFFAFGMYRRFWRYASIFDLIALVFANIAASGATTIFVAAAIYRFYIYEFSRSVLILDWLMCLALTAGVRLAIRVAAESHRRSPAARAALKRVLIIGAGDAGILVAREMQRNSQLGMKVMGFLDDDPVKVGKSIHGRPVCGTTADLRNVINTFGVTEVVIAMPKAPGAAVRRIAEDCRRAGIVSRTIPGVFELLDGKVSVSRLRQVEISDLLRRPTVDGGPDASQYVHGRDVLVTGAGGSIGYELCRQIAHNRPRRLILLGHGENSIFETAARLREDFPDVRLEPIIADVRDQSRVPRVFERFRPEIVFHAAAHKHVPLMEHNPEEAISNNVLGTQNVVESALAADCQRFVMISTDKAVAPSNMMGASKRVAEAIVRDSGRRASRPFVVVRFGNVLGSRGSVVPIFKQKIEAGGPIPITHPEMKRYFMTIPEAVHLVVQAGGIGRSGELFVLKMGEPMRIVQLAEDLVRLSGLTTDEIPIVFTGLRAGEKLEESLWESAAIIEDTEHPEVLRVIEPEMLDGPELAARVELFRAAVQNGDLRTLNAVLADLMPWPMDGLVSRQ